MEGGGEEGPEGEGEKRDEGKSCDALSVDSRDGERRRRGMVGLVSRDRHPYTRMSYYGNTAGISPVRIKHFVVRDFP